MSASDSAAIIDTAIFTALQDSAGADFVIELVDTFLEEGPQMLQSLRSAYAAGDETAFKRAAHSLKSNGQTFGALGFAALARQLELEGLAGVQSRGEVALLTLERAYGEVALELQELVHG
jgi:HPt (histidine-containing phosphotransfer) domain-containing protein